MYVPLPVMIYRTRGVHYPHHIDNVLKPEVRGTYHATDVGRDGDFWC